MGASDPAARPVEGLALPGGAAALVGALVRLAGDGVPDQVGVAALAATAAAAPQVLEDPAHDLLSSVPQSWRRRVGHRLVLFLPVLLVAWALVAPLVVDRHHSAALSVGPLLAVAAIGVAGGCLTGRVLPVLPAPVGTAIPLGIVAIRLVPADGVNQADILDVWIDHPWATAAVAGLICLVSPREAGLPRLSASTGSVVRPTGWRPSLFPGRDGPARRAAGR